MPTGRENPRRLIEDLMMAGDLIGLIDRAAEVHGHYCPGLALGVKAAYTAIQQLDILHNEGMENIMAVVECNNCFVDGIQVISGCTLGNNALIYKDFGKTAVTFYRRDAETGLRLVANGTSKKQTEEKPPATKAEQLFDKAVKRREPLTSQENQEFKDRWKQSACEVLERPAEEVFKIETVQIPQIEYAPIFNSVACSVCGEKVMETRIRIQNNAPVCLACAGEDSWMIAGRGIHPVPQRSAQ